MDREGGKKERMRKCRELISPHFLSISSFSLHFLFISSFSRHFLAARLQGCNDSCSPVPLECILHKEKEKKRSSVLFIRFSYLCHLMNVFCMILTE